MNSSSMLFNKESVTTTEEADDINVVEEYFMLGGQTKIVSGRRRGKTSN